MLIVLLKLTVYNAPMAISITLANALTHAPVEPINRGPSAIRAIPNANHVPLLQQTAVSASLVITSQTTHA